MASEGQPFNQVTEESLADFSSLSRPIRLSTMTPMTGGSPSSRSSAGVASLGDRSPRVSLGPPLGLGDSLGVAQLGERSRRSSSLAGEEEADIEVITTDDARHAMATLTVVRVCRSRVSLRLAEALSTWHRAVREVIIDRLVQKQLVPLLKSQSRVLNDYRPHPEEYVMFGDEPAPPAPMSRKETSSHLFEVHLLRDELVTAEAGLALEPKPPRLETPSRKGSEDLSLRLGLDLDNARRISQLSDGLSPALSPVQDRLASGLRSPTPTDFSESATSLTTPARSLRGHSGLTLKQLSEGDRALSAAVERELRRAAELAKVKQRLERTDTRLNRAQQTLRDSLAENEKLRAQLAAGKGQPAG
jgi:hypothetical protein